MHLTQFYTSNLYANPSFTGRYDGDYRAVFNHRNQWRQVDGPMTTNMFSIEKRIDHFDDAIGLGVILINDKTGNIGLKTNKIFLSTAYEKRMGKNLFRFGFQGGMVFRSFDLNAQKFPGQWDYGMGDFDTGADNGETGLNESISYVDLNVGISYVRKLNFGTLEFNYAINHLNQSDKNFVKKETLPMRNVIGVNLRAKVLDKFTAEPYIFGLATTKVQDILLGLNVTYPITQDIDLYAGIGDRASFSGNDSFIAMLGAGYGRYEFRFSNDATTSNLNDGGKNKSAYEISLIYTTSPSTPNKIALPCDRY